jgi:hypothetical protein
MTDGIDIVLNQFDKTIQRHFLFGPAILVRKAGRAFQITSIRCLDHESDLVHLVISPRNWRYNFAYISDTALCPQ